MCFFASCSKWQFSNQSKFLRLALVSENNYVCGLEQSNNFFCAFLFQMSVELLFACRQFPRKTKSLQIFWLFSGAAVHLDLFSSFLVTILCNLVGSKKLRNASLVQFKKFSLRNRVERLSSFGKSINIVLLEVYRKKSSKTSTFSSNRLCFCPVIFLIPLGELEDITQTRTKIFCTVCFKGNCRAVPLLDLLAMNAKKFYFFAKFSPASEAKYFGNYPFTLAVKL